MKNLSQQWNNLFPKKWDAAIFGTYLVLFVNQGLLVTGTKTADNRYTYNTVVAVFMTECIKLVLALAMYLRDNDFATFKKDVVSSKKVFVLYMVPATLYCLYNNLAYINLLAFDPTSYLLLLQFRVVVTGVIYQCLFSKQLSAMQWFSLVLLTLGCLVKNLGHISQTGGGSGSFFSVALIFLQVFCSCFAGVYNEYLLKGSVQDVHVMIQNVYMYANSILCNIAILLVLNNQELGKTFSIETLTALFEPLIVAVLVNNALCGIITSIFLKNLNSILKSFAAAIEPVFIAILAWFIFKIPLDAYTIVAILIVSSATYLYSISPVVNPAVKSSTRDEDLLVVEVKVDTTNQVDSLRKK